MTAAPYDVPDGDRASVALHRYNRDMTVGRSYREHFRSRIRRRGENSMNGSAGRTVFSVRGSKGSLGRSVFSFRRLAIWCWTLLAIGPSLLVAAEIQLRQHTFTLPDGFTLEVIAA